MSAFGCKIIGSASPLAIHHSSKRVVRMFVHVIVAVLVVRLQNVDLAQKSHQWPDQVLVKVEIVMRHVRRRQEESRARAPVFELVGVADGNEPVELAVDDERRACDVVHPAQIVELLRQEDAQEADLVRRDALDRRVR